MKRKTKIAATILLSMAASAAMAFGVFGGRATVTAPTDSTVVLDGSLDFEFGSPNANCSTRLKANVYAGGAVTVLGSDATTKNSSANYGFGEKEYLAWIAAADSKSINGTGRIANSSMGYYALSDWVSGEKSGSYWNINYNEDDASAVSDISIRLNGLKSTAKNESVEISQHSGDSSASWCNNYHYFTFNPVSPTSADGKANTAFVYPDSYPDMVYPTKNDLQNMIPWYGYYPVKGSSLGNIDYKTAKDLYNNYKGSSYLKRDYVNNYYKSKVDPNNTFMSYNITSYYSLSSPTSCYKFWLTGNLSDNINTVLPTGASKYNDVYEYYYSTNSSDKLKKITYPTAEIYYSETLRSTWQISADNTNWTTVLTNSTAQSFRFNVATHYIEIGSSSINTKGILGEHTTYYIRRIGNYSGVLGSAVSGFSNITSPSMRIRTPMELERVEAKYIGKGVVAGTYLDPKDVEIYAYYSNNPTVPVVVRGDTKYAKYDNLKIYSVSEENYVHFTYTSDLTGATKGGYFTVKGLDITPISISASYAGTTRENTNYDPGLVQVSVRYNNGSVQIKNGKSIDIGLYKEKLHGKGDCDGNGVINAGDLAIMEKLIAGQPGTTYQKNQADLNSDGKIDDVDRARYNSITDKKCVLGSNTFYAAISGLKDKNNAPVYAKFIVDAQKRKPYNISINTPPDKMTYIEGEDFDPKGMILTIEFDNSEIEVASFERITHYYGISFGDAENPSYKMNAGQTKVPIYYTEGDTTIHKDLFLKVSQKTLTSIKIHKKPDKTTYFSGENFDAAGMEVYAYFNEDSEGNYVERVKLSGSEMDFRSAKNMQDSRDYVVIHNSDNEAYGGYERYLLDVFAPGQSFENGKSGSFKKTNGSYVTGKVEGNYIVTISYTHSGITKHAYLPIDVLGKRLASIEVVSEPDKKNYVSGQDFIASGMVIRAKYTDGSTEYVYEKTAVKNGYEVIDGTDLTPDRNELVVSYTDSGITEFTKVGITVTDPAIISITATYTGDKVSKGSDYNLSDVLIIVNYDNGSVTSFRADETNSDGTLKIRSFLLRDKGDINDVIAETRKVENLGYNYFAIYYGGYADIIMVEGIRDASQVDYSSYVGQVRRKSATWTEEFTGIKLRTIKDYISDAATAKIGNLAKITQPFTTDTRGTLSYKAGTAFGVDPNAEGKGNALLNFLREGTWRPQTNEYTVEYSAKTAGYQFPETTNPEFQTDESKQTLYLYKYHQNRDDILNSNDGYSDWVNQGDSVGTILAKRHAYNYSSSNKDASDITMYINKLRIRLKGGKDGDAARLYVRGTDTSGTPFEIDGIDENTIINNPATLAIELRGQVGVTYPDGSSGTKDFGEVYSVYYRAVTDENTPWAKNGEITGANGVHMQGLEIIVLMSDSEFNPGALSTKPYIAQQPVSNTILCGNEAFLSVVAVGNDLQYQWYKDGEAIPEANETTYRTPELELSDNGSKYWCVVFNSIGDTESTHITVNVSDILPRFTKDLGEEIAVEEYYNQDYTFEVEAYSYAPENISYAWEFKRSRNDLWQPLSGENSNTCTLKINEGVDGWYIRCIATNTAGSTTSNYARIGSQINATVNITCDTPFIAQSAMESIRLRAVPDGIPGTLSYTWIIDGKESSTHSQTISWVPAVAGSHEISVRVSSNATSAEVTGSLRLRVEPPVTTTIDQTLDITNKTAMLRADTSEGPNVTYSWVFDGENVSDKTPCCTLKYGGRELDITDLDPGRTYTIILIAKDKTTNFTYSKVSIVIKPDDWKTN